MSAPVDPEGALRLMSAEDVRRIDAAAEAIGEQGLATLMARAGAAVARSALRRFNARRGPALVLAGPGMNGGDGAVAARLLAAERRQTTLALLSPPQADSLAAHALQAWRDAGGEVVDLTQSDAMGALKDLLVAGSASAAPAFLIDALFGVGLTRPLAGPAAEIVQWANAAAAPILAVDIPSGVAANTGRALGPAIDAWATVSFIAPKRGVYLSDGAGLSGAVEVVDIAAPAEALRVWPERVFAIGAPGRGGRPSLRKPPAAHKYRHGSVLVASGGAGASGAARLAARAALRSGAGLVTIAAPSEALAECAAHATAGPRGSVGHTVTFAVHATLICLEPGRIHPTRAPARRSRHVRPGAAPFGPPSPPMKRLLLSLVLVSVAGAGAFVVWMNSGGGAAVELSDKEKAAALESGAGSKAIEVATEPEEDPLPTMEDLKLVTDPGKLDTWAERTRSTRDASTGEDRLLLTVLLADIERLR
ncbi:MAG: NAD(P)H-hydrate epimerase, partial [Pseudomonadota bacterium]